MNSPDKELRDSTCLHAVCAKRVFGSQQKQWSTNLGRYVYIWLSVCVLPRLVRNPNASINSFTSIISSQVQLAFATCSTHYEAPSMSRERSWAKSIRKSGSKVLFKGITIRYTCDAMQSHKYSALQHEPDLHVTLPGCLLSQHSQTYGRIREVFLTWLQFLSYTFGSLAFRIGCHNNTKIRMNEHSLSLYCTSWTTTKKWAKNTQGVSILEGGPYTCTPPHLKLVVNTPKEKKFRFCLWQRVCDAASNSDFRYFSVSCSCVFWGEIQLHVWRHSEWLWQNVT